MSTKNRSIGVLTVCLAVAASIGIASADWVTATVPASSFPSSVALNPVTNKIYVGNEAGDCVTVIDGATYARSTVIVGNKPMAIAVNPVTNKIYVANQGSRNVTVIDGASYGTTTVAAGSTPYAIAVNPVTDLIYVALGTSNNVAVITDAPSTDAQVRAAFDRLPGEPTEEARPALTGKGVNRLAPGKTAMIGVGNRAGTAQVPFDWANVTAGAGTDSIAWSYTWGADSLVYGENFVCAAPFELLAASSGNLGLGSPFAGNLEVYPIYRVNPAAGVEEKGRSEVRSIGTPTIARGILNLQPAIYNLESEIILLDTDGRQVMTLHSGANDVRALAPGVYFVQTARSDRSTVTCQKVVVTR